MTKERKQFEEHSALIVMDPGAVHHGLSGRAAPQVSRSRWTDE